MRILIVRIGAMGDAIHTLPLVNDLRDRLPKAEISWLAGPAVRRFLSGHPAVDRWVPAPRKAGEVMRFLSEERKRYDVAIDAQGLIKSALLARAASSRVIGRASGFVREAPAAWVYTEPIRPRLPHIIEQNRELALPLTGPFPFEETRYDVPIDPPPEWDLLEERPVLLNIGGGWWTKLWPPEMFAALAKRLREELDLPVGVVWGPGEETLAEKTARMASIPIAPRTSFRELGGMFRKARLVVSGETGPLHLAVALGIPTVALIGPTSAERNGPLGSGHEVVEPEAIPCRPCYARRCIDFRCMNAISVDKVFEAVNRIVWRQDHG